jgi:predicted PurR-regulated permease PerM
MQKSATVETDAATPIWISPRTRQVLVAASLGVLALILWRVTTLVTLFVGGAALAIALSFPVDGLSRVMPRRVAIAVTLVFVAAIVVLVITVFAPIIADQLGALVAAVPVLSSSSTTGCHPARLARGAGSFRFARESALAETQTPARCRAAIRRATTWASLGRSCQESPGSSLP